MTWDPDRCQYVFPLAVSGAEGRESFQILLDGDWNLCLHPDRADAGCHTRHRLCGPDAHGHGLNWTLRALPGDCFLVRLHLSRAGLPEKVDWKLDDDRPALPALLTGHWEDEDGTEFSIEGSILRGPDGLAVALATTSPGCCSFETGAGEFHGRLAEAGRKLRWSDGTAWARRPESPAEISTDAPTATSGGGAEHEELAAEEAAADGGPSAAAAAARPGGGAALEAGARSGAGSPSGVREEAADDDEEELAEEPAEEEEEQLPHRCREEEQRQQEAEEAAEAWAEARLEQLHKELRSLRGLDAAKRRARLRALQLELHPDKQPQEQRAHAQRLFLLVQRRWEAEAAEAEAERRRLEAADKAERRRPGAGKAPAAGASEREAEEDEEEEAEAEAEAEAARRREEALRQQAEELRRTAAAYARAARRGGGAEQPDPPPPGGGGGGGVGGGAEDSEEQIFRAEALWRQREAECAAAEDAVRLQRKEEAEAGEGAEASSPRLWIKITELGCYRCTVVARRNWFIWEVKEAIQAEMRIHRHSQRLLHESTELFDDEAVADLPVGDSLDLTMVICLPRYCEYLWIARAVRKNWRTLQLASSRLRSDRGIVWAAMRRGGWTALRSAHPSLGGDRALIAAAVDQDGLALQCASEELRDDVEIVSAAIRRNWRALQYASMRLRAERDVVLQAAEQDAHALDFAAPELMSDRRLFEALLQFDGLALRYASPALRADKDLVLRAARQDGNALAFAAASVREDEQFVRKAVPGNREALRHVRADLRDQVELDMFDAAWSQLGFGAQGA